MQKILSIHSKFRTLESTEKFHWTKQNSNFFKLKFLAKWKTLKICNLNKNGKKTGSNKKYNLITWKINCGKLKIMEIGLLSQSA